MDFLLYLWDNISSRPCCKGWGQNSFFCPKSPNLYKRSKGDKRSKHHPGYISIRIFLYGQVFIGKKATESMTGVRLLAQTLLSDIRSFNDEAPSRQHQRSAVGWFWPLSSRLAFSFVLLHAHEPWQCFVQLCLEMLFLAFLGFVSTSKTWQHTAVTRTQMPNITAHTARVCAPTLADTCCRTVRLLCKLCSAPKPTFQFSTDCKPSDSLRRLQTDMPTSLILKRPCARSWVFQGYLWFPVVGVSRSSDEII